MNQWILMMVMKQAQLAVSFLCFNKALYALSNFICRILLNKSAKILQTFLEYFFMQEMMKCLYFI